jgi:dTDP-4-amino-4,6-dideoxygalactose transaminase
MLETIWERRILTNSGPFHQELEARLRAFLDAPFVSLTTNGMLALSVALEAAGLEGEVVTTPYSFVATTHSVLLEKLTPVFADVRPNDLNIDPAAIEAAITPCTSAILGVHCYGNPCDVLAIEAIAARHGLCVIYDAAHAFGVRLNGQGVFAHGDYSCVSFHATKAFNTFEGGAVVSGSAASKLSVDRQKNFGIADEENIPTVGTNAKMSELNAAIGLLQLDHFAHVRRERGRVDTLYRAGLAGLEGIEPLAIPAGVEPNYSYFPLLVGDAFPLSRDGLYEHLKVLGIYSRRYFFPLLSNLAMYADTPSAAPANLPVANDAAARILCLPIYPDLSDAQVERIVAAVRNA